MWKKILVPHDFSPCAARATALASRLARVHGAEMALVHVSSLPPNLAPDAQVTPPGEEGPLSVDEYTTRGALRRLEAVAEPLRRGGISVLTRATTGEVAQEVLDAANELGADVVVVGTHGRTGLSHLLLGSVAERLVREASVPVITVRSPGPGAEPIPEERAVEDELAG